MPSLERIRRATVAGAFYPGDAAELARTVDGLLRSVPPGPGDEHALLAVSPHAGYIYSGHIAAHGFARIRGQAVHTVVIIGPSHVEYFEHTSVYLGDAYQTPLGDVPINTEVSETLLASDGNIRDGASGHERAAGQRGEHGIEVQLPFLQRVLGEFQLVAVVMGNQNWDRCEQLGAALTSAIANDPGVLIVASTDLSHFYDDGKARVLDETFGQVLATMDPHSLDEAIRAGTCEACGAGPVMASLLASAPAPARSFHLLSQSNSGDVSGDRSSVVGYLSALVTTPS